MRKNNQLLFLKNRYQYPWSLPGGFLKKGEDVYKAIQREIKEETGLDIKINRILDIQNGSKKPIFDIIIDCEAIGGEIKIDKKEVEQAKFYHIEKLPDSILYIHEPLVEKYKNFT